jgi:hypothetical protein
VAAFGASVDLVIFTSSAFDVAYGAAVAGTGFEFESSFTIFNFIFYGALVFEF